MQAISGVIVTGINSLLWPSGLAERIRDSRSSLLLFMGLVLLIITLLKKFKKPHPEKADGVRSGLGDFQYFQLREYRRLIFCLKHDRRNRFAGLRVEPPCQNSRVKLEVAANYSVPATVSHQHRGNNKTADRQTLARQQFLARFDRNWRPPHQS